MRRQAKKKILKMVLKKIGKGFLFYLVYILFSGYIVFLFASPPEGTDEPLKWVETDEKVVLLEEGTDAWKARIDMIEAAEETIDISYFAMQGGHSVEVFYSYLLEAADRGVQIRFLADGIFHGMYDEINVVYLFSKHPNIELKFYEPLHFLKPWRWNNRLHDKIMVVDNQYSITGGRNIGDRFFTSFYAAEGAAFDRDIMLLSESPKNATLTGQVTDYYNELWELSHVDYAPNRHLYRIEEEVARRKREDLAETYEDHQASPLFNQYNWNWWNRAVEIESGTFVSNGLERGYKEPVVWHHLLETVEEAEEVVVQSPYVILDRYMREDLETKELPYENITLITNGINASPNYFAHSGYQNHREKIVESDVQLVEYQSDRNSLHMKSIVLDGQVSIVGTFNVDPRSAYLNTESMMFLNSPELSKQIQDIAEEEYLSQSIEITEEEDGKQPLWPKRMIIWVLRPFARIFEQLL